MNFSPSLSHLIETRRRFDHSLACLGHFWGLPRWLKGSCRGNSWSMMGGISVPLSRLSAGCFLCMWMASRILRAIKLSSIASTEVLCPVRSYVQVTDSDGLESQSHVCRRCVLCIVLLGLGRLHLCIPYYTHHTWHCIWPHTSWVYLVCP